MSMLCSIRSVPSRNAAPLFRFRYPPGCTRSHRKHFRAAARTAGAAAAQIREDFGERKLDPPEVRQPLTQSDAVQARFNEIGVQQLSSRIYPQIFSSQPRSPPRELVDLSKAHLAHHDLLGKNQDQSPPIDLDLPPLQGASLDEHFYKVGRAASEPFLRYAREFAASTLSSQPRAWVRKSGWTKYYGDGRTEAVEAPQEAMLTFDTEVMWKDHPFAVMACAASPEAWYAWISPWLLGESSEKQHLIPLGDPQVPRIVVGHNVGYDRARVKEEYSMQQSQNFFLDTMSLHVAVNGMCSRQRPTWMKQMKNRDAREKMSNEQQPVELTSLIGNKMLSEEDEELWVGRSSINSLRDVAKFHCNIEVDKTSRDFFGELGRDGILEKLDDLLHYCATDVFITHQVYKKVLPGFLNVCPHPVSFGALRHLASVILPIDRSWQDYICNAESTYQKLMSGVQDRLKELANAALAVKAEPKKYSQDPWLRQLDWSGQDIRMVKGKKKGDPLRPAARQKLPGMPKWYKSLFASNQSDIALTVRTRIAPLLLRLAWDGNPLIWSDKNGWVFKVPVDDSSKYEQQTVARCDMAEETNEHLRDSLHHYFKLPHKDGCEARCANPLAKGYLQYFDGGILASEYPYAREALEMNASCSYWISTRDRITSQMAVYGESATPGGSGAHEQGFILPQLIPMGTITRRSVENTWLTASNAKKTRVGSELKSMVKAPPGYHFVGADVDSQELWIASVIGDAQFQMHGGNAVGFMTLEGTRSAGTDLHSKTAGILGISRNDAKVFNYGRIYGAGLKFAATLLRQFNPSLSEEKTQAIAAELYRKTKGTRTLRRNICPNSFWRGGSESFVFNTLEAFADQERPRTPVLGAGITEALMRRFISKGAFMTSRINWAIQSSGVDYLHLLIISMQYLISRFSLDARLAITVHDEIRYLAASKDRYKVAMALQVANLWTRAMFSQQIGIDDLPQSCAFFSAVDIDHVLRKEVDMDCVTPSNPTKIPPGESLDIWALKAKGDTAALDPSVVPRATLDMGQWPYEPRQSVMAEMHHASPKTQDMAYLRAQVAANEDELRTIVKTVDQTGPSPRKSIQARRPSRARSRKVVEEKSQPLPLPQNDVLLESRGHDFAEYSQDFKKDGWRVRDWRAITEDESVPVLHRF